MKNNLPITAGGYSDPALEREIETKDTAIRKKVELDARHLAENNMPEPEETHLSLFTDSIIAEYQDLAATAEQKVQAGFNKIQGTVERKNWEEEDKKITKQIADTDHSMKLKKREKADHQPDYDLDAHNSNKLGIAASATLEALMSRSAFQIFGDSILFSYLIATLLGWGLYKSTFIIAKFIRNAPTLWKARLRLLIVTVAAAGFFYCLAYIRVLFLKQSGALGDGMELSPFYFVIINLFLYATSCYLAMNTLPTDEAIMLQKKYMALEEDIKALEKKKSELIAQQETLKQQNDTTLMYRASRMEYEKYIKNKIDKLCQKAIALFISENIKYRRDGKVPACFRQAIQQTNPDTTQNQ